MINKIKEKQEVEKYGTIVTLLTIFCGAPILFLFATERNGFLYTLVYIIAMFFLWGAYAKKYHEVHETSILKGSIFDNTLKHKTNPNKNVNREAGNFYAQELVKARKNNDSYKAYECATKIIESAPFYVATYCNRALLVFEYFCNDEGKMNQALADLKHAYELDKNNEVVISAINSSHSIFNEKYMGDSVKYLQKFHDTFPQIAILGSRPVLDLDCNDINIKNILLQVINSCTNYINNGCNVSFLYSRRAAFTLQLYNIQSLDSAVDDLLQAKRINPNSIFDSLVRIESFDYIIRILDTYEHASKLLNNNIQELESIVKNDISIVENLNYETFSDNARSLRKNLVEVDGYLSTLKSQKIDIKPTQTYTHQQADNTDIEKESIPTHKGRELDI